MSINGGCYLMYPTKSVILFKKELKGVVDKHIVKEICLFIEDAINDLGVDWASDSHRLAITQITEDFLSELQKTNSIEQFKVICDRRNNKSVLMEKGTFQFDVSFRQKNCLNTTQILYTINIGSRIELKSGLDWAI